MVYLKVLFSHQSVKLKKTNTHSPVELKFEIAVEPRTSLKQTRLWRPSRPARSVNSPVWTELQYVGTDFVVLK